jgi:VWFA-related protein
MRGLLAASVLTTTATTLLIASGQKPPERPLARVTTTGVLIDIVAKDRKGLPVDDLTCNEFELTEDGVPQQVSFCALVDSNVSARSNRPAVTPASPSVTDEQPPPTQVADRMPGPGDPSVTALLFDRLSPEVRSVAVDAALTFVDLMTPPHDYAGVFMADLTMQTFQPFTNDQDRLRGALERLASTAPSSLRPEDQQRSQRAAQLDPTTSPTAAAEFAGNGGLTPTERERMLRQMDPAERALALMEYHMEQSYFRLLSEAEGEASTAGLRAAVSALSLAPGRKSLIYFAQEVVVTPRTKPLFERLIEEANAANVTVYTIDAAGLRAHSQQSATARQIAVAGAQGLGDAGHEQGAWTRDLEKQAQVLSSGTGPMARISAETGGFLLENTNDLTSGMQRIKREQTHYYLLYYQSTNPRLDGTYRHVDVRVKRRGVRLHARPGYFAKSPADSGGSDSTAAWPSYADSGANGAARADLPIRATALVFPQPKGDPRVALVAETAASAMTFEATAGDQFRTDFTLLARILDANGEEVRKASQPYRLAGPLADEDKARSGDILFYRQPTLPPGTYTLDVAVDDALARKAGVTHVPLTVPADRNGPDVSDLVLIARTEKVAPTSKESENVLTVGDVQLYPNLGDPYRRTDTLAFYALILPDGAPVTASITLGQGGRTLATVPVTLPDPDTTGRIQELGRLPLSTLPPGAYTLTLTVNGGPAPVTRSAAFTVQ